MCLYYTCIRISRPDAIIRIEYQDYSHSLTRNQFYRAAFLFPPFYSHKVIDQSIRSSVVSFVFSLIQFHFTRFTLHLLHRNREDLKWHQQDVLIIFIVNSFSLIRARICTSNGVLLISFFVSHSVAVCCCCFRLFSFDSLHRFIVSSREKRQRMCVFDQFGATVTRWWI